MVDDLERNDLGKDDLGRTGSDEPTVWKIVLRDDIRITLVTDADPLWAKSEADRDWYLEHMLHRPREDYTVEEVPGPVDRAIDDELERWARVKVELRAEARERFLRAKRGEAGS